MAVKSVPLIAISAVGVLILMFSLSIFPRAPVMNRAVPEAKLNANFDFEGFASYTNSSIIIEDCSVSFSTESSKNCKAILPCAVLTSS